MSLELLAQAASHPAFDPTPIPASLAACHVPFELLQSDDLETGIAERLRDYGRIALVGPPGCGKSSVARYVSSSPSSCAMHNEQAGCNLTSDVAS